MNRTILKRKKVNVYNQRNVCQHRKIRNVLYNVALRIKLLMTAYIIPYVTPHAHTQFDFHISVSRMFLNIIDNSLLSRRVLILFETRRGYCYLMRPYMLLRSRNIRCPCNSSDGSFGENEIVRTLEGIFTDIL